MNLDNRLKSPNTDDATELCDLVNSAYRGEQGWTKETDIVSGERTNTQDIKALILNPKSHLLVATENKNITACVCIEKKDNQAYIGLLAVNPAYQNKGIGKKILHLAERYAVKQLYTNKLVMVVITQRTELISFYERRGYKRTGEIEEYPISLNVGMPMVEGLTIEYLTKNT